MKTSRSCRSRLSVAVVTTGVIGTILGAFISTLAFLDPYTSFVVRGLSIAFLLGSLVLVRRGTNLDQRALERRYLGKLEKKGFDIGAVRRAYSVVRDVYGITLIEFVEMISSKPDDDNDAFIRYFCSKAYRSELGKKEASGAKASHHQS